MLYEGNYDAELTARRVKELRLAKRPTITQVEAAKRLGIARNTYRDYEQNRRGLKPEMLVNISKMLDTTTNYLLGLTDDPSPVNEKEIMKILDNAELVYNGKNIEVTDDFKLKIKELLEQHTK